MKRRIRTEAEHAQEAFIANMQSEDARHDALPAHWVTPEYVRERKRLHRVALAAVRRDIKQRGKTRTR